MRERPVVFDGAMGSMLYEHGVFLNRCYDELNLTSPQLIQDIHNDYVKAGADVIETNTFAANRIALGRFGLGDKVQSIIEAATGIARAAAGERVYVAGSLGPCLRAGQVLPAATCNLIADAYTESAEALARGGADCILLETFSVLEELLLALTAVAGAGLPVIASFTVNEEGFTAQGRPFQDVLAALNRAPEAHAIGMNCGTGPGPLYAIVEQAITMTAKPMVVMPNAGRPENVDGRMLFLSTPEYFTSYAKRFIKLGVRGIGGCCGTNPDHIRELAAAVHVLSGVKQHIVITAPPVGSVETVEPVPMAAKSRFGAKLAAGEPVTSVEILPPRSCDLTDMLERVRICHAAGIDAINVPDGPRASARISPMIACLTIEREVGIETILHYCCRDRNLIGMQSDLLGGFAGGLRNFLIITGDPPKIGDYPDVTGVFDVDAIGLTQVVSNLNRGLDIGGKPVTPAPGILIGVGVNPCAVSPETEWTRFRQKIDAGAEFAITQPVFDPAALHRFLDRVDGLPHRIPVVAGVWPLISYKNAEFMKNEVPGVEIPDPILDRMSRTATREEGIACGVEIAREIRDAIASRVAGFQVSAPFGRVAIALDVLA